MRVPECDECMNNESMMLQPLMMLGLVNEFMMTYDIDLNDHNINALMNDIACEYAKLGVLGRPSTCQWL